MDELRLALRRLLKRPASTLASIATLAAAIGAAAVTWSALSAVLINPLPVRDADNLLVLGHADTAPCRAGGDHGVPVSAIPPGSRKRRLRADHGAVGIDVPAPGERRQWPCPRGCRFRDARLLRGPRRAGGARTRVLSRRRSSRSHAGGGADRSLLAHGIQGGPGRPRPHDRRCRENRSRSSACCRSDSAG